MANARSFVCFNERFSFFLQTANVRSLAYSSVFLFLGFSVIIPDRDFQSVFRFSITFPSFIGIRWFKRLVFRLEILFPFKQLKQVFATVKFDLDPD